MTRLRRRMGIPGERDFTLFLAGTSLSCVGSAMVPVALSFALFARGAGVGRVSAVLADRFASRRIMVAADLLRAAARSVLEILLLSGPAPLAACWRWLPWPKPEPCWRRPDGTGC